MATLNFENLDGTGFVGSLGSNNNLTGHRIYFTVGTSRLVNHADMPETVRKDAIKAVNIFKSRKDD